MCQENVLTLSYFCLARKTYEFVESSHFVNVGYKTSFLKRKRMSLLSKYERNYMAYRYNWQFYVSTSISGKCLLFMNTVSYPKFNEQVQ